MSADVHALPGVVQSSRKQAWLDQVAQAYDKFVARRGAEPDGMIVLHLGDSIVRSSWHVDGPFKETGFISAALLIAAEHLRRQAYVDELEEGRPVDTDPAA